jgi:penicillin-binding protein 1B
MAASRSSRPSSRRTAPQPAAGDPGSPPPWRRIAVPAALFLAGLAVGFLALYFWAIDRWLQGEFGRLSWREPTRVYARSLALQPGMPLNAEALLRELRAGGYREGGSGPGSFSREGERWQLHTRTFADLDGAQPAQRIALRIQGGRLRELRDGAGAPLRAARVDPARIATLYGEERAERRLVALADVPPLLIAAVQAVEDRSFKDHAGVDLRGILRALFTNVRAGEVREGASTLTQQLVRNLYLSREQSWTRKLREAAYALCIEARFDKGRILEVYLNQVYLGQQGSQAVHGIGAGAEFWFGRGVDQLGPAEIALLVGLIQGPALHDPRKHPERGLARRNRVLEQLADTGVIDPEQVVALKQQALGVTAESGLRISRHPAFLDLVLAQLERDFPPGTLNGQGLQVLTTLAPMAQLAAEQVVQEQLSALREQGQKLPLQAAMLVSDTRSGELLAMVGGLGEETGSFNRALEARRPVGSLLKPFVYLLALAQPERYSLATMVEDAPLSVRTSAGQSWSPENADKRSHGWASLAEALVKSYNQATVRVGLAVGVDKLSRLIDVLIGVAPAEHPSLLLGAVDLSPLQMTQLYQFIAAGGQVQPLRAVRGVLDRQGKPLSRYREDLPAPDRGDTIAARLVTLALQDAVRDGTARRLQADGLGWLQPAGKTGTSNDSRDSWFAGWGGDRLAVVWVGDDRNRPTGLYGSTGAMRLWSALFRQLPSEPLVVDEAGLERAWVMADAEVRTDAECEGAREMVFVAGYSPQDYRGCTLSRLRNWFGSRGSRDER